MNWIKDNKAIAGGVAVVGVVVLAILAFPVFGVHTLFIDDVVDEDGPVFASGAGATTTAPATTVVVTTTDAEPTATSSDASTDAETTETTAAATTTAAPTTTAPAEPVIVTLASGSFIDRDHPGTGTAVVLNDGTEQRFIRFEDDFATDNGPDLFVYLSRGVDADSPEGQFDDDFINLGELKGNQGSQNYEIPVGVDLSEYDTVSVWCRRFSSLFTAADLVAN